MCSVKVLNLCKTGVKLRNVCPIYKIWAVSAVGIINRPTSNRRRMNVVLPMPQLKRRMNVVLQLLESGRRTNVVVPTLQFQRQLDVQLMTSQDQRHLHQRCESAASTLTSLSH